MNPANAIAASALTLIGKPEGLRALDQIQKDSADDTLLNFDVIPSSKAAFEVHAGNGAKAVELLARSKMYEPGPASLPGIYVRGMAYLQTRSGVEAAGEFQKIIDNRGVAPMSELYPLANLGLGRAYAMSGDPAKARKAYQDFLELWKEADPDIPILVQVKKEYQRLAQ